MSKMKIVNQFGEEIELSRGADFKSEVKSKFKTTDSAAVKRFLAEQGLSVKNVMRELGVPDINRANIGELIINDGTEPLFNAIVEDGLRIGFEKESNWQALVARDVNITQMSYSWYYLDTKGTDVELRDIGQGAEIPVGFISLGGLSIKMSKRGRGIEWTDEAKAMNFDLVALWLAQLGKRLGRDYERVAVDRLYNGYFATGEDAAPVVGVKTAGTLKLTDLYYAYQYMNLELGYDSKVLVMNLKTAMDIIEMQDGNGAYLFTPEMKAGTFPSLFNNFFISEQVPDDKIIFTDTSFALVRYTYKDFGVEFERSVKTQTEGSYGTEISEFVPFDKNARLILDITTARP